MDSPSGSSTPPSSFPRSSTPPSYSPRTSTHPSFSPRSSRSAQNLGKAECSNCKFLAEKIKTLEARIRILEGQLEMERHPENHTLESAAILHEIYNGMGNLNMEFAKGVELIMASWLEVQGKISTHILSPNTIYRAYLIVQVAHHRAYGLNVLPFEVLVELGDFRSRGTRSSTSELFTPYKEPEREFRSSRRHFKRDEVGDKVMLEVLRVLRKIIKVDKTLRFAEEPVEIIDRKVKSLKRSRFYSKVAHWNSKTSRFFKNIELW
ncbi:F-box domain, phloem protein 2-like protein [Tanacetum coccineum]